MADVKQKHISAIDFEPDIRQEKLPLDAGDPKSFSEAIKETKQALASEAETLKWIMGEEKGRKFFYDLLALCHILRNPFSRDALSMSFDCGEMNIGQQVFAKLQNACPDLYLLMMNEAKERANG